MALKIDGVTSFFTKLTNAFNASTIIKNGGSVIISAAQSYFDSFKTSVTDGVNASNGLKDQGSVKLINREGDTLRFAHAEQVNGSPFSFESSYFITGASNAVLDIPCSQYAALEYSLTGIFSGLALAVERWDGTQWKNVNGRNTSDSIATAPNIQTTAGSSTKVELFGASRFRIRIILLTSGYVIFTVNGMADSPIPDSMYVTSAGTIADGVPVLGNPVRIGARAVNASPTVLTNGQTADLLTTLDRRLIVLPYAFPENTWPPITGTITNPTAGQATTVKTSAGAGLKNYVAAIQISHSPLSVETIIQFKSGASGTLLGQYRLQTAAETLIIPLPIPISTAAATLLEMVIVTAVTGSITYNIQGYTAP